MVVRNDLNDYTVHKQSWFWHVTTNTVVLFGTSQSTEQLSDYLYFTTRYWRKDLVAAGIPDHDKFVLKKFASK